MSEGDLPQVDIAALHEAIKQGLRKAFSIAALPTIDCYARPGENIVTPAVFFEMDDATTGKDDDAGSGQLSVELSFSAWCVVSSKGAGTAHVAVRTLALAVAAAIKGQRWGQAVSTAAIERIEAAEFASDPNRAYCVYRVGWTHEALVGTSVWDADKMGIAPSGIYLGRSPEIGNGHEKDYTEIV
jgi:hypothetical protein